jgi:nucleoside-diphosphate-sugar epimerase
VEELVGTMGELLGKPLGVEVDPKRFRPADKMIQTACIDGVVEATGWRPSFDLRRGLRTLLHYEGLCNT